MFVGGPALLALALATLLRRRWAELVRVLVAGAAAAAAMAVVYLVTIRPHVVGPLTDYWTDYFPPVQDGPGAVVRYVLDRLHQQRSLTNLGSLPFMGLVLGAGLATLVAVRRLTLALSVPQQPAQQPLPVSRCSEPLWSAVPSTRPGPRTARATPALRRLQPYDDLQRSRAEQADRVPGTRIYVPAVQEGYEWVLPVDEADHEVFRGLDGTPWRAGWRPVPVYRLRTTRTSAPRAESDLPWLASHLLVLREKAVAALGDVLADYGKLLPLSCPDAELWVFNALRLVDALDEEQSTLVRFTGGRIADIQRHVFHPDRVAGVEIFRLPQMPRGWLYLSGDVVDRVQSAGLRGAGFDLVWADGG